MIYCIEYSNNMITRVVPEVRRLAITSLKMSLIRDTQHIQLVQPFIQMYAKYYSKLSNGIKTPLVTKR